LLFTVYRLLSTDSFLRNLRNLWILLHTSRQTYGIR
jgi:hypothetical protein